MNTDSYVAKILKEKEVLVFLLQNLTITILSIMKRLNWERGKATRFLACLNDLGIVIEKKKGKVFLNTVILNTFDELRKNQQNDRKIDMK